MPKKVYTLKLSRGRTVYVRNTSRLSDAQVKQMVRLAADDLNVDQTAVWVKHDRGGSNWGRAYLIAPDSDWMREHTPRARSLVVARDHGTAGQVVNTIAHEFRHIDDYRSGLWRKIRKTRQAEQRARAYGDWIEDRWQQKIKAAQVLL